MSLVSRALAIAEEIAPGWALRREEARARRDILNQGYSYHGASRSKKSLAGWITQQGGPDSDITLNLGLLRQRSRDLCMGEPLAVGALKTIRTNEVGVGLKLNPKIDGGFLKLSDEQARKWEEHTAREFASWAGNIGCDAAGRCNFDEMQALVRLSELMSGDVFAMLPSIESPGARYDLRIHLLEADRVSDPWPYPVGKNVLGGVEVGELGEPIAYYVAKMHPGDMFVPGMYGVFGDGTGYGGYGAGPVPPLADVGGYGAYGAGWNKWERIPAVGELSGRRLVLHVMDSDRPGQRRGIPLLAPVMEIFKGLSRYSQAEITAAVVSGFFTAAITSETPQAPIGFSIPPSLQTKGPADDVDFKYELGPGTIVGLAPGEKLEAVDPTRPNASFEPFVSAMCRQIAAGLPGLTYGLLIKYFDSSFTAARAELLQAWKAWMVGRARLVSRFCQPIYESWLEEAVARGYIVAPGFLSDPLARAAWCGADWHGPAMGQLNPVQEVSAAKMRVEEGFSTRAREAAELGGGNFEQMTIQREREERLRRDAGLLPPTVAAAPAKEEATK